MWSRVTRLIPAALFLAAALIATVPAMATVTMEGRIRIWNPISNLYQPLPQARVRLVLAEYWDSDTLDVEGQTDTSGYYRVTKGNAWWREGYDAYLIVFAEVPNKLEIQTFWGQIDGYQAVSSGFFTPNGRTTSTDLNIGGPNDNCRRYQVGGVAALNNSDSTSATRGANAFFLCHQMTDHRLTLVAGALRERNFEEKEVVFPDSYDTALYNGVLDYIRFSDSFFTDSDKARISETARHELSHGIMADEYWTPPGWMHGNFGTHSLFTVAAHREWAWSEAWAEFLAELTHRPRYGPYDDYESPDASWRSRIPAGADHSRVEGEIAGSLWDIYDPVGWEKRTVQEAAIPGEEQFYDGITDPDLAKIWGIFSSDHPHSFTHEKYAGAPDSFVHYWLGRSSYGARHELKAILFNREIYPPEFTQRKPTLSVGTITWAGNVAQVPVTVTELDSEDRPHNRLELFVNDTKTHSQWLSTGWNGATNTVTLSQEIAWRTGEPQPRLLVAVHDNMQASYQSVTLDPPASASVGALVAEVLAVNMHRHSSSALFGSEASAEWLRDVSITVSATNGSANQTTRLPQTGTWAIEGDGEHRDETTREVFRTNGLPPYLELTFTLTGRDGPKNFNETFTKRFSAAENLGLGTHLDVVLQRHRQRPAALWVNVDIRSRVEILYRIRAANPTTVLPAASQVRAVTLAPVIRPAVALRPLAPVTLTPTVKTTTLIATQPLTGQETPTVILSRASQLLDEQARLQAQILEAASELEWRLAAPSAAPGAATRPAKLKPRTPSNTFLRKELMAASGVLTMPQSQFLDQAAAGRVALTALTPERKNELQNLRREHLQRETRLGELEKLAGDIQTALSAAVARLNREQADARTKQLAIAPLRQGLTRIALVAPAVPATRELLQKQRQVIDRSLQSGSP